MFIVIVILFVYPDRCVTYDPWSELWDRKNQCDTVVSLYCALHHRGRSLTKGMIFVYVHEVWLEMNDFGLHHLHLWISLI